MTRPRTATLAPQRFAGETELGRKRRARRMARLLADTHPDAHCELDFTNPLELAVATVLSAQTTDVRVNQVTPELFRRYRTAADYAAADRAEMEALLRPTGFFRAKTNSLIGLGQALVDRHQGEVPRKLDQLVKLPGIGRKTANVVLGNAFGVPGITVDTHFRRLTNRFGWVDEQDEVKIEFAVAAMIEKRDWTMLSHRVIFHGRRVCHARTPACGACTLASMCPSYGTGPTEAAPAAKLLKGPRARDLAAAAGVDPDLVPATSAVPEDAGDTAVPTDSGVTSSPGAPSPDVSSSGASGSGASGSGVPGSGVTGSGVTGSDSSGHGASRPGREAL